MNDIWNKIVEDKTPAVFFEKFHDVEVTCADVMNFIYKEAITDLINKAATSGMLGAGDYVRQNLASLSSNYLLPQYQMGQNLLSMLTSQGNADANLAAQIYASQLPYLAQINNLVS